MTRVNLVIQQIRRDYVLPLRVKDLVGSAATGVSTFHRRFKAVTAMSPLQYQKRIRLLQDHTLLVRALTVVDNYTHECLAIDIGQSLKGEDVVNTLNRITLQRGLPATIKVDNGSEFISKAMDRWAYEHGVELDFSRPGTPTDNAKIESFNGRFRQECLNMHWFLSLEDAIDKIDAWRQDYNESHPHSALQWATPAEFARQAREIGHLAGIQKSENFNNG